MAKSTFGMDLAEFAKRGAAAQKAVNELGAGPKAATPERVLLDMYIAGVQARRKLTNCERDELCHAWLAGFIARNTLNRTGEPSGG